MSDRERIKSYKAKAIHTRRRLNAKLRGGKEGRPLMPPLPQAHCAATMVHIDPERSPRCSILGLNRLCLALTLRLQNTLVVFFIRPSNASEYNGSSRCGTVVFYSSVKLSKRHPFYMRSLLNFIELYSYPSAGG